MIIGIPGADIAHVVSRVEEGLSQKPGHVRVVMVVTHQSRSRDHVIQSA